MSVVKCRDRRTSGVQSTRLQAADTAMCCSGFGNVMWEPKVAEAIILLTLGEAHWKNTIQGDAALGSDLSKIRNRSKDKY